MADSRRASEVLIEPFMQVDAAARGAANIIPTKPANRLEAATEAMVYGGKPWRERYAERLALQEARDAYDALHRPTAQAVGQAAGTLAALMLLRGRLPATSRLPGAAALSGREAGALAMTGAMLGMGAKTATDLTIGQPTSLGDNIGSAVGGSIGGVLLPYVGPVVAGGIGGWTESVVQDIANGRPVSLGTAGQSAVTAGGAGKLAGGVGAKASNSLPPKAKGRLGEAMGAIRSEINGQGREIGPKKAKTVPNTGGRKIFPDGRHGDIVFEDKFGEHARLSKNQTLAQSKLGKNFVLYHFTPADVGKALALPASLVGSNFAPVIEQAPGLLAAMVQNGKGQTGQQPARGRVPLHGPQTQPRLRQPVAQRGQRALPAR